MNRSDQIGQLVTALAAAQAEFQPIEKDKHAKVKTRDGGSYGYSYADLATCVEATGPALHKHGLVVIQPVSNQDGKVIVTSLLAHSSGEWISEEMAWPGGADPKALGSAVTYARRYGYLAIIGAVARDEDDDGQAATVVRQDRPRKQQQQQSKPQPPSLPADGAELVARLTAFDTRLADAGLCDPGDLLDHVRQEGEKLGYVGDMVRWSKPAIDWAVKAAKRFEAGARAQKNQPVTAN